MSGILGRFGNHGAKSKRVERLAARIDALAEKDESELRKAREIAEIRRLAAAELYAACATFVSSLNRILSRTEVRLDPPEFPDGAFQEDGLNIFQISVSGRVLQIEFATTPLLVSTEDFRVPYTMQGELRWFNQELLEHHHVEERLLFYSLEADRRFWRVFDMRTNHSSRFDREYLVELMESLI